MKNIERKFAWPSRWPTTENKKTKKQGSIGQIYRFVKLQAGEGKGWIDPMCGRSTICEIRNDFRKAGTTAQTHMDALEFLKSLPDNSAEGMVYDPPYNDRQGKMYTKHFHSFSDVVYWSNIRKEIGRVLKPGALCVMLNWNSNRLPECTIERIQLYAHGSERHDTIVTVQRKNLTLEI